MRPERGQGAAAEPRGSAQGNASGQREDGNPPAGFPTEPAAGSLRELSVGAPVSRCRGCGRAELQQPAGAAQAQRAPGQHPLDS